MKPGVCLKSMWVSEGLRDKPNETRGVWVSEGLLFSQELFVTIMNTETAKLAAPLAAGVISGALLLAIYQRFRKYTPPTVWGLFVVQFVLTFDQQVWKNVASGGKFANINAPTSGARVDKELPVGKQPIQLYSLATPNGVKVTIMLEELCLIDPSFDYDAWCV